MKDAGLAEQVRQYRVAARLTQAELADRVGVSERAISDIERGVRARVYSVTARALADALGLAGEARASLERAAQAGRMVPAGHEPSVPSRSPVAHGTSAAVGAEHWRAMRRAAMVGREDELAFLPRSLRDDGPRLHSITGPGGMGKSRLAADVCAARADDGVAWVSLAAVRQPEFVLSTIAAAAGLPPDASLAVLAAALDAGTSLLVLDTFEPVLAAANDVAGLLD